MRKLADESESFSSKTVLALLRSAPDLTQHLNNIEALYEPPKEKGRQWCFTPRHAF